METLHEEITDEIRAILDKWKPKEGNLIMILHGVQQRYGYVPWNISKFLASELSVPLARIFEVVTFYNFFNLEAPADYKISVCTGTACHLKGAPVLIQGLKKQLKISPKAQYTEDRKFKVEEVRCVGCCGLAPAMVINEEVYGRLKPEDIEPTLETIKIEETS
ncbi:MAG TPA: NAD(P)H-dependent oxidoreductase subunit E [Cytophagales bacterium]|jgi:NADH-quinone oxidoreductase subunit E|nr:NAD(P)H-dependent oxidoreductase subunit E [Cytophagales bacterium]